jgi:hypothetical protein
MASLMRNAQKIVVHFLDRTLLRGHARFFFHVQDRMEMTDLDGAMHVVDLNRVKAVFFVRRFEGDPGYPERREFGEGSPVFGQRIRIVFRDGEEMLGRAMGYRPEEKGFYFKPADPRSNNEIIFVPVTALREVQAGEIEPDLA